MGSDWSPEQIALTLGHTYPKGHKLQVLHETFYNCFFAQPMGELSKVFIALIRQVNNKRSPRSKGQYRLGQLPDKHSFHVRPP
jgi:IS30 family transposase